MVSACLVPHDDSSGAKGLHRHHHFAAVQQAALGLAPATATKEWHVVEPSGGQPMAQQQPSSASGGGMLVQQTGDDGSSNHKVPHDGGQRQRAVVWQRRKV